MKRKTYWVTSLLILCLALSCAVPAVAVEKGKISTTAEVVCAFRSIAALDPDPKTRNPDYMAKDFVNPAMKGVVPGLGQTFEAAKIAFEVQDTGVFYYVNARTLHMDKLLKQALDGGTSQVVILGAGFDSRAYRFHGQYPDVRFFEIDLPATSGDKQDRVEKILGSKPGWVTYVPIDFNHQTLEEVLAKAGFDKKRRTFYVWEGVTYFISKAGVESTLRFIADHSAPGSRVVFDYMLADVVQGRDYSAYGSRKTVFWVAYQGEPYVYGIAPGNLENIVNRPGLKLLSDLGPGELSRRYLTGSRGKPLGRIAEFLRIVHAQVPAPAEKKQLAAAAAGSANQAGPAVTLKKKLSIPAGVLQLMDQQAHSFRTKDLDAFKNNYSDAYVHDGRNRTDITDFVRHTFRKADFEHFKIVLTRFDRDGDRALIDGYVDRRDYRTPLMIRHIAKEADGQWRWIGNQR